jgi:hypothetical protein
MQHCSTSLPAPYFLRRVKSFGDQIWFPPLFVRIKISPSILAVCPTAGNSMCVVHSNRGQLPSGFEIRETSQRCLKIPRKWRGQ